MKQMKLQDAVHQNAESKTGLKLRLRVRQPRAGQVRYQSLGVKRAVWQIGIGLVFFSEGHRRLTVEWGGMGGAQCTVHS
jgi:hypothetical protein